MTTTDVITLKIDDKAHSYAKVYSSLLNDEFQRKRAYASLVALYSFVDELEKTPYSTQKSMTLFKNPQLNEQYEISDIYINGWHIDIRIVTGGDAVLIPKIHYDSDIVADFYVVIKVDSMLQNAELLGVVDTSITEPIPFDYHYNSVPFSSLIGYKEFLTKLVVDKSFSFTDEEHELFRTSYLALLDNNLDLPTKNKVLRHLFDCCVCRTEFCCFTGFEMVCCNTSKYPEVLEDHMLGFVGAQNADDVKYDGKEETVYIGTDEEALEDTVPVEAEIIEETLPTEREETVSDILDNLFDYNEGTIEEEIVEETPIIVENVEKEAETELEELVEDVETNVDEKNDTDISIDDIIEEVATIQPEIRIEIETEEQDDVQNTNSSTEERDRELQLIDDSVFLDVPSKYPNLESIEGELHIIPDETQQQPEFVPHNNIEEIPEEFSDSSKNEEILVINDVDNEEEDSLIEVIPENDMTIGEVQTIKDETDEEYSLEKDLIINSDDDIENIEDEIIDEATMLSREDNVQKVIVDYDDAGEPIYSYITDVEQEENEINEENSLLIDEEEVEEYIEEDEETTSEIEDIEDSDMEESEYDSVYSDEDESINDEKENISFISEEDDEQQDDSEEEFIQYKDDDEVDIKDETSIQNIETEEYEEYPEEDEEYPNDEEEYPDDEEEYVDDDVEYSDEDIENDEATEEDEEDMNNYDEDEEYDVDDYLPDEQVKKSSGPLAIIISLIVLLGLAGAGVFFFLNKEKSDEGQLAIEPVNENIAEISNQTPENAAVNDMFEQPVENSETTNSENQEAQKVENSEMQAQEQQPANNSIFEEPLPAAPQPAETTESSKVTLPELTESDLIKPKKRSSNGDVNKTIVNAFATSASPVSLRALNWFCASDLFSDINFKNYLQTVDNSLKQNLRNNFMSLVESSPKDSVAAKFAIDNRGNLKKVIISETSGSAEIDNVVLQSINETFESEKSQILNDNELKQDMYYLKVVIKL